MQHQIYRKSALSKLSSPEQLDQLMQVTTAKGWISLISLGILIIITVIWSVFGSLQTEVNGQGIFIKSGGIFNIISLGSGQITELYVKDGDIVQKGQIVARIAQHTLIEEIEKNEVSLIELKNQMKESVKFGLREIELQSDYLAKQSKNLKYSIEVSEEKLKWLKEKIVVQEDLLQKGLITKQTLLHTKQSLYSTKEEIEKIRNHISQISINELSIKNKKKQENLSAQLKINEIERLLKNLKSKFELTSKVISPYSGRILEVLKNEGSVIQMGNPIFRLDLIGDDIKELEAVIYIPPNEGKKITTGMEIQIEPSTIKREEFGFILGKVTRVAQFPSTPQGMIRVLKNKQLVNEWLKNGAPFEVYADLCIDSNTGKYKWSSKKGSFLKIHSGTICDASIIVRKQTPISLVIPLIKEYTGI